MDEMIISIPINEELCNYIEMISYEMNGYNVLYTHALSNNVSKDKCKMIESKFIELSNEYNLAKTELQSKYINPIVKPGDRYTWNLDFSRRMIYVYK